MQGLGCCYIFTAAMFTIKKIISVFVMPLGLVVAIWLAGAVLFFSKKRRGLGGSLMLLAALLLVGLSLPVVGQALLRPLETDAGSYAEPQALALAGVRDVVVLAGGTNTGQRPVSDKLSQSSLKRLIEGVHLWRGLPRARLILSGGVLSGDVSSARRMADLAQTMGVPPHAIVLEEQSKDTADEARLLVPLLSGKPFALVTSASHMPRSLALFKAQGLDPVPAPTDFRSTSDQPWYVYALPCIEGLYMSSAAFHEYLGLLWARFHDFWPPQTEPAP